MFSELLWVFIITVVGILLVAVPGSQIVIGWFYIGVGILGMVLSLLIALTKLKNKNEIR